jgi:hypothetical protein
LDRHPQTPDDRRFDLIGECLLPIHIGSHAR